MSTGTTDSRSHSINAAREVACAVELGLTVNNDACEACGMQPGFAQMLKLIQKGIKHPVIFRVSSGKVPMFDRPGWPKPGSIFTKLSNQGFFKGFLPMEKCFTCLQKNSLEINSPSGHNSKDHLDTQKNKQLPIRLRDIYRELGPHGDLEMVSFDDNIMRFRYKEGINPQFNGDFVIKLDDYHNFIPKESRPWEAEGAPAPLDPEETGIIEPSPITYQIKPPGFPSQEAWDRFYKHTMARVEVGYEKEYQLYYTNEPLSDEFQKVQVFSATGELNGKQEELIVHGDWDCSALGFSLTSQSSQFSIGPEANVVYNTFNTTLNPDNKTQQDVLLEQTLLLARSFQAQITEKEELFLSALFEKIIMELNASSQPDAENDSPFCEDWTLSRAGCITPFELIHTLMINHAYKKGLHLSKVPEALQKAYQVALTKLHHLLCQKTNISDDVVDNALIQAVNDKNVLSLLEGIGGKEDDKKTSGYYKKHKEHLMKSLRKALDQHPELFKTDPLKEQQLQKLQTLKITHPDLDENTQYLKQHGNDNRNPYGSNLGGPWLMITENGTLIHGKTEEQQIAFILKSGFLLRNGYDVNPAANMAVGWYKVVQFQIEKKQTIPPETLKSFEAYKTIAAMLEQQSTPNLEKQLKWDPNTFMEKLIDVIENYSKHKQPIPNALLNEFVNYILPKINKNEKLTDRELMALSSMITNQSTLQFDGELIKECSTYINKRMKEHKYFKKEGFTVMISIIFENKNSDNTLANTFLDRMREVMEGKTPYGTLSDAETDALDEVIIHHHKFPLAAELCLAYLGYIENKCKSDNVVISQKEKELMENLDRIITFIPATEKIPNATEKLQDVLNIMPKPATSINYVGVGLGGLQALRAQKLQEQKLQSSQSQATEKEQIVLEKNSEPPTPSGKNRSVVK